MTKRTQKEIVERIEKVKSRDFFGFQTNDLLGYLDFQHAKPYLVDEATEDDWNKQISEVSPKEQMIDYISFAYDKIANQRSLSMERTTQHYMAWLWLDGDEELVYELENMSKKKQMKKICKYLGVDNKNYK